MCGHNFVLCGTIQLEPQGAVLLNFIIKVGQTGGLDKMRIL